MNILTEIICLRFYAKGRCTQNSTALFYLPFYIRDSGIAQKTCLRSLRSVPFCEYFNRDHLFTFLCEGTMHAEFNSIILFTVLYSRFRHCAKDVSKVTAQRTILECSFSTGTKVGFATTSSSYKLQDFT